MRATIFGVARINNSNLENGQDSSSNVTSPRPRQRRPLRPPLRPPLHSRDHNAMIRVPQKASAPLTAKRAPANMPSYDKQSGARPLPFMSTLSASAKTSNRTPL